jgi:hypothetical protein
MKYVQDRCAKATWQQVEDIIRHHIDIPIKGELTREKIKAAGSRTVFYRDDGPHLSLDYPVHEDENGNISMTFDSGLIGLVQGHTLIMPDGTRRPLTDKEESFLFNQGL